MSDKKQKTYCRACGNNKGHAFSKCKNAYSLRQIIVEQDHELESNLNELVRLRQSEKQLDEAQSLNRYLNRIISALLTLVEKQKG